jgi:hypothetical protein
MRNIMLVGGLAVLMALAPPTQVRADTGRTLTGELVVLNGSKSQFRLVGHGGPFTAPSGTSLERFDGKTVQVELGAGNRVVSLQEVPVPINPVEHGLSKVRGELVVVDPVARRFTVAGDSQTYTAPPPLDVTAYAGKIVEFTTDQNGRVTEFHVVASQPYGYAPPYPAAGSGTYVPPYPPPASGTQYNTYGTTSGTYDTYGTAPAYPAAGMTTCTYAGQPYSAGAAICQAGSQYRCNLGQWQNMGTACGSDAKQTNVPPGEPRPCIVGGATVANGSGICRDGSTLRCEDGTWINTQIACR